MSDSGHRRTDPPPVQATTLWAVALVYLVIFGALAASGPVSIALKSFILPGLLIPAALSPRFRRFLGDWLPFLSLTVLFDACRAFIYAWIVQARRPVRIDYPILADRALFQTDGTIPALLQAAWFDDRVGLFEHLLVVVHASHFMLFFAFGFWLWRTRRTEFARFTLAIVFIMAVGLVGYAMVPTMPPWMAARVSGDAAGVVRISERVYSASVPALLETFDTNPVAAMPSLHMAFPVLMALLGSRVAGLRAVWLWGYVAVVAFTLVYLGEHYVVDLLAGAALAGVAFMLVYRSRVGSLAWNAGGTLGLRLLVGGVSILVAAEVLGQLTLRASQPQRVERQAARG